jgi:hypothetical protein
MNIFLDSLDSRSLFSVDKPIVCLSAAFASEHNWTGGVK